MSLNKRWSKQMRSDNLSDDDEPPRRRMPERQQQRDQPRRYSNSGSTRQFYGLAQGKAANTKRFRGYDPEAPNRPNRGDDDGQGRRARSRSPRRRERGNPTKKLFIGNLSFNTREGDLKELFSKFGDISDLFIPKNAEGESKGFGFVEFESEEAAIEAVETLDGSDFEGRRMGLEYAKPRREGFGGGSTMRGFERSPPRGRRDGGRRGGRSGWRGRGGGGGRGRGGRGGRDSDFNKGPVDNKALDDDLDAYFGRKETKTTGTSGGDKANELDSELDEYFKKK